MICNKNLVIAAVGKNSLHREWLKGNPNFDIALLYYDDYYDKDFPYSVKYVYKLKGEKLDIIKQFVDMNLDFVKQYDIVWIPDDDVLTNAKNINKLFEIHERYNLWLSQPSISGFTSHEITRQIKGNVLRYTNFVETMCAMMDINTFLFLLSTFNLVKFAWGIDLLWAKKLGYPKDKIAIIDSINVEHTRKVGEDYSRLEISPQQECERIIKEFDIHVSFETLSSVKLSSNQ